MNALYAGFGRVNATPMLGIPISEYFKERRAEGVLDGAGDQCIGFGLR